MKHDKLFSRAGEHPVPLYASPELEPLAISVEAGFANSAVSELDGGSYPTLPTTDWEWGN